MAGMGELAPLEIYIERIRPRSTAWRSKLARPRSTIAKPPPRPVSSTPNTRSRPAVPASTPTSSAAWSRCRKTLPEPFVFEDEVTGGRIPKNFIPAVEKGFRQMVHKGPVAGYPVVGLKVILEDGSYHDVDSSDMAFQTCARYLPCGENFTATRPVLLEPVMKIEIECPTDFQGSVVVI